VDTTTGRPVVAKELRLEDVEGWKAAELFEREAAVLAELNHPGIPKLVEHGYVEKGARRIPLLVCELAPGRALAALQEEGWRAEEEELRDIARQVLEILRYLHGRLEPVIHRDVNPHNLIRDEDGTIRLVDFGAVCVAAAKPDVPGSTVVGTWGFMAPEQFHGQPVPQSDLYSLGCTLLCLASGVAPADLEYEGLRVRVPDALKISEATRTFVEKLTAPTLEGRYEHAAAALSALEFGAMARERPDYSAIRSEPIPEGTRYHFPPSRSRIALIVKLPTIFVVLTLSMWTLMGLLAAFHGGALHVLLAFALFGSMWALLLKATAPRLWPHSTRLQVLPGQLVLVRRAFGIPFKKRRIEADELRRLEIRMDGVPQGAADSPMDAVGRAPLAPLKAFNQVRAFFRALEAATSGATEELHAVTASTDLLLVAGLRAEEMEWLSFEIVRHARTHGWPMHLAGEPHDSGRRCTP